MGNLDFTVAFPCRNRYQMANDAIRMILDHSPYPLLIVDDNSDDDKKLYIQDERVTIVYNDVKSGLTKLWNQILRESKTEYLILGCDKIRPVEKDFKIVEDNLTKGIACVATYMLGFFGFSKELTTRIGFFDEGFTQNGSEDTDWMNKLFVNDLSLYFSMETSYLSTGSSWGNGHINRQYYNTKWREETDSVVMLHDDLNAEDKEYFKGVYPEKQYLPWSHSELKCNNVINYYTNRKGVKENG